VTSPSRADRAGILIAARIPTPSSNEGAPLIGLAIIVIAVLFYSWAFAHDKENRIWGIFASLMFSSIVVEVLHRI